MKRLYAMYETFICHVVDKESLLQSFFGSAIICADPLLYSFAGYAAICCRKLAVTWIKRTTMDTRRR